MKRLASALLALILTHTWAQAQVTFAPAVTSGNPIHFPLNDCSGDYGYRLDDAGGAANSQDATALWSNNQTLDFSQSFQITFDVRFSGNRNSQSTADGITFTMHRDPAGLNAIGSWGGLLGASNSLSNPTGIAPAVTVEFDIFNNSTPFADIAGDHMAIFYNGDLPNPVAPATAFTQNTNNWNQVVVTWTECTNTLQVTFNGSETITLQDDIVNNVFGGNPAGVFFGFTASSGGSNADHDICFQSYQVIDPCCSADVDVSQVTCGEYDFTVSSSSVNILGAVWTLDGVQIGTGLTANATTTSGFHTVCVNFFGPSLLDPDVICCEQECVTFLALVNDTVECVTDVTIGCGDDINLGAVADPSCDLCEQDPSSTTGPWMHVESGNVVPFILNGLTQSGTYQQITTTGNGCLSCVKTVNVTVQQPPSALYPINIFPNCPCMPVDGLQMQTWINQLVPGHCLSNLNTFSLYQVYLPPGQVSPVFTISPGFPTASLCEGNSYRIYDPNDPCCAIEIYIACQQMMIAPPDGNGIKGESAPATLNTGSLSSDADDSNTDQEKLLVIPNPATDAFTVQYNKVLENDGTITVFAPNGQQIAQKQVAAGTTASLQQFDASTWSSGVYLLKFDQSNHAPIIKRFVVK